MTDKAFNWFSKVILIFCMLLCIIPFLWMVLNSFKDNMEIYASPLTLPKNFNFQNFADAWKVADFNTAFLNSLVSTAATVLLVVSTSALAAYPLSRMNFIGRNVILIVYVGAQVVSREVVLVSLFNMFKNLSLLDTLYSIILANTTFAIPFSVFLFWGFFRDVSVEIEEATKIDGCSSWNFLWKVLIPVSLPVVSTVIIFQSLNAWNDFLFSVTFLRDPHVLTIPIKLQVFFAQFTTDWAKLFSALTITVLPVILLYLFLQKFFINGLVSGAVKG